MCCSLAQKSYEKYFYGSIVRGRIRLHLPIRQAHRFCNDTIIKGGMQRTIGNCAGMNQLIVRCLISPWRKVIAVRRLAENQSHIFSNKPIMRVEKVLPKSVF